MAERKFSDEQIEAIQIDLDCGLSLSDVAIFNNTTRQVIEFIAKRKTYAHVNPDWRYKPRRRELDERMIRRMWRMWRAGYTEHEIQKLTGIGPYTIKRKMKEMESKAS